MDTGGDPAAPATLAAPATATATTGSSAAQGAAAAAGSIVTHAACLDRRHKWWEASAAVNVACAAAEQLMLPLCAITDSGFVPFGRVVCRPS